MASYSNFYFFSLLSRPRINALLRARKRNERERGARKRRLYRRRKCAPAPAPPSSARCGKFFEIKIKKILLFFLSRIAVVVVVESSSRLFGKNAQTTQTDKKSLTPVGV